MPKGRPPKSSPLVSHLLLLLNNEIFWFQVQGQLLLSTLLLLLFWHVARCYVWQDCKVRGLCMKLI